MNGEAPTKTKILSHLDAGDFIGRTGELDRLRHHAKGESNDRALLLLSPPAVGASEILLQTYDRFFYEQDEIIPFYFAFKESDKTIKNCARRFLQTFLLQAVSFRRKDSGLLKSSPEINEIAELAPPADGAWIDRLVMAFDRENRSNDERSFIRNCFSAPLRAATRGMKVFVMLDDFHHAENLRGETDLVGELKEIYSRANVQFVFAGRRRFVLKAAHTGVSKFLNAEILRLERLSFAETGSLIEHLAAKYNVSINEQTRDLIVRQFDSNPLFIESIFIAAKNTQKDLNSFQNVQQIYVDELFGGRIGKYFDTQFYEIEPNFITQTRLCGLLNNSFSNESKRSGIAYWQRNSKATEEEFRRILPRLHAQEIINFSSNLITTGDENLCLKDYVEARYRLEIMTEQRASVVGNFLAKSLKRAPQLMAKFYRRSSALDLRELLANFNCQSVPLSLLDYERFKEKLKGETEAEIFRQLETEAEKTELPGIVYTATGTAFYPPLRKVCDQERCAVGFGFDSADFREENEIIWIAAEVDSKLEAEAELTEFWCDRLEMAALMCNFQKYRLWLITPEGFSPEALEILKQRNAFGSSREQISLFVKYLKAENVIPEKSDQHEFELVVPMGDDTEMIAAHTVEEIARRHAFDSKAITQIKTALVEACINATEHSLSPDRKIYQKFKVENDKLIITISNRGVKIPPEKIAEMTAQIESENGRRGWGLKLMRTLMDEVKFEQADDGTRISMVKYLK